MGKGREGFPTAGRPALPLGLEASGELKLFLFCQFHNLEALFPPSPCKKEKFYFKKKSKKKKVRAGVGRRTRFAEPRCSLDLFKPLVFPLP